MKRETMDGDKFAKEEDGRMAVFAKPNKMTFEVSKDKFDQFNQKDTKPAFRDTIKKFELHSKGKNK